MFKRLKVTVKNYNNLGHKKAVLQKYNMHIRTSFILYVIINLMCYVYKKIL